MTNQGELYMTVAFANGGNRDAALLRVEPALWGQRNKKAEWIPLVERVHPNIPVTAPKTPAVIRAGGVEMMTLSAKLDPLQADGLAAAAAQGGAFVGIRVATMNSDGNLFLLHHAVARLLIDSAGRIQGAEPADSQDAERLHRSRGRSTGRPAAVQQENAVRMGRRTVLRSALLHLIISGRQVALDIARQAARRAVGLEEMAAQAVREPDEVQARVHRRFTGRAARFAVLIEHAGRVDERLEAGAKSGRRDDRIERLRWSRLRRRRRLASAARAPAAP